MSDPDAYAELEVDLARVQAGAYRVELRFQDPDSKGPAARIRDAGEKPRARGLAPLDLEELAVLDIDPDAYGETLTAQLFHDADLRLLWARAKTAVESRGAFLRLRLRVDPSAPELHAVRWELLRDPETREPLASSERTPFSRFIASHDWRPIKLRPKEGLRALVAVAAPSNLERYGLAEVDRDGEIERAAYALDGLEVDVLGRDAPLTAEALVGGLRRAPDILYLMCHGVLARGAPGLFLQDGAGEVEVTDGNVLARRVAELARPPRLVVLASCESAGTGELTAARPASKGPTSAEAALAPRLAEAGVPAILAMQGKISMETVERALPIFFRELVVDGQIDRALAVARAAVHAHDDAWMPALFLRLRGGRIWYVPGFRGEDDGFAKWRSIVASVRRGSFVPILGADVGKHIFGTTAQLARTLGERHGFPLAEHEGSDLAKVTQFLGVDESRHYAREEVLRQMRNQVLERLTAGLETAGPQAGGACAEAPAPTTSLPRLLDAVVTRQPEDDPFRLLARLPAPLYVTAALEPLLLKSIKAAGREPVPLLTEWRSSEESHPAEPEYDHPLETSRPVVFHAFGVLGKAHSLVLTEDDIYDYLIATAEHKLVPAVVRGALTRSSLLFLGFRFNAWTFRLLFRLIVNLGGHRQLRDYAHVGVQVDPSEHEHADVERARRYLEDYFGAGGDGPPLSIYWGSAADFLRELRAQLDAPTQDTPATPEEDGDDWLG